MQLAIITVMSKHKKLTKKSGGKCWSDPLKRPNVENALNKTLILPHLLHALDST